MDFEITMLQIILFGLISFPASFAVRPL